MESFVSKEAIVHLLTDLVKIESPYFHEHEAMAFVLSWMQEKGLPCRIHRYHDPAIPDFHGENITGFVQGSAEGPTIYLGGHLDTVQLCEGWTLPPYQAVIRDDQLYGVGALDMKGGCVALLYALSEFYRQYGTDFRGRILYQLVSDEEGPYGLGTYALINENIDGIDDKVDFAVMCEPSAAFTGAAHPCLCLGARGGYDYMVSLQGLSAHAATPEKGINAVSEAARAIQAIEQIPPRVDDKLGHSTTCIIGIQGGANGCSVPDHVDIEVFHHCVRGETPSSIQAGAEEALRKAGLRCQWNVTMRQSLGGRFDGGFVPYCTDENDPYLQILSASIQEVCGKKPTCNYFQSMGDFNHIGGLIAIPTVLFGPDGKNFHSADERVNLQSVYEVSKSIFEFLKKTLL